MRQKIKAFDSVQLMRRLRDQMSEEMAPMSPQERILYIQQKAAASPLLTLFSHRTRPGVGHPGAAPPEKPGSRPELAGAETTADTEAAR